MQKNKDSTIKLEKLVPGGQALGVLPDGRKVFVWGGLPSETIEVEITKSKRSYAEGTAIEVLEKSPHRIVARDDCYLSTSPWQIMDYEYELAQKAELTCEAFRQEGIGTGSELASDIVTDGSQYNYRNKMEYALYWDNEKNAIELAFHKRGSHQKIPIAQSSIERPEILAEAKRIVDGLNARGEQARKYQSLLVRCDQDGEASSALFENGKPHPIMRNLTDTLLGREYSYSPNGFFQINLPVYETALREIARYVTTEKVVDMYAGVGTIGLSVAADRDLILVETNASAFQEMIKNIPVEATNIVAVCSKSEDALEHIASDAAIIVDPPRAGLDTTVVDRLIEVSPPTIIYLSCNPTTQARDVAKLLPKYEIAHAQGFNFFPRTPHIENLIILTRRENHNS